jgi:hypothetical protein
MNVIGGGCTIIVKNILKNDGGKVEIFHYSSERDCVQNVLGFYDDSKGDAKKMSYF